MSSLKKVAIVLLVSIGLSACVSMSDNVSIVKAEDGVLVSMNNMTVYTFDGDRENSGQSTCYGECAINWPPLLVAQNATSYGHYSIITRTDGKKQFAYKGMPLYYSALDKKPGDRLGNNANNGAWKTVKM